MPFLASLNYTGDVKRLRETANKSAFTKGKVMKDQDENQRLQGQIRILEYQALLDGYHSRDEAMPRTFFSMTQVFAIHFTMILGVKFLEPHRLLLLFMYLILTVSGILSMLAFLVNLQGLSSSKNALRERCARAEADFGTLGPGYWQAIAQRKRYAIESHLKPYNRQGARELRIGGFGYLVSAQVIFWLWVTLVGSVWFTALI